jgi:hypothetical protein
MYNSLIAILCATAEMEKKTPLMGYQHVEGRYDTNSLVLNQASSPKHPGDPISC